MGSTHSGLDEGSGRGWKVPDSTPPRAEAAGSSSQTSISTDPPEALSLLGGQGTRARGPIMGTRQWTGGSALLALSLSLQGLLIWSQDASRALFPNKAEAPPTGTCSLQPRPLHTASQEDAADGLSDASTDGGPRGGGVMRLLSHPLTSDRLWLP